MFCPKCHTELDDNIQICTRCGTKVDSKSNKNSWGSFSSTKTFERMNRKEIEKEPIEVEEKQEVNLDDHNEEHQEQYNYSKQFSNVTKDNNEEHQEQYSYSEQYSNTTQETVTSEQDYIDAYIGNSALINLPFSFPAILLGPFYYLYRKMFSIAIILIILYISSYVYLNEDLGLILRLVINIVLAFKFNKKYKEDVEKRIKIIKIQNQNATSTELLDICKRKGKPLSSGILFIVIILYFASIAALLVNEPNTQEEVKETKIKTEYSVGKLHYIIPKDMEETDEYINYQFFKDKNDNGTCFISVSMQNTNMTEKEYLVSLSSSYNRFKQNDIEVIDIKNNKWSLRKYEGTTQNTEIYVMKDKTENAIYEFNFDELPPNSQACKADIEYIFKNIEV